MKTFMIKEYTLTVGQNAKENDELITNSNENFIWFHLANLPSCHGILNCTIDKLTSTLIFQCACKIKKNTKYKKNRDIKVNYIELKFIQKTNKLGEVLLLKKPFSVNT